jgi:hypothetical protein
MNLDFGIWILEWVLGHCETLCVKINISPFLKTYIDDFSLLTLGETTLRLILGGDA